MRVNVAYVHPHQPQVVLQAADGVYVLVQCRFRTDIGDHDIIAGDPLLANVKWFLNVTRGLLIDINVLGHYPTLAAALLSAAPSPPAAGDLRPLAH